MTEDKGDTFYNRSLERALQILNAFNGERQIIALTQLSEVLGIPKATVLRLCSTLVQYDYLRQDPDSKQYSLGLKLFELGSIVFSSFSLRRSASPHLTQLQARLGQTVYLGILDHDELLYIDKKEDLGNPIRFTSSIGNRRPPYWGMVGPMLMAYLSDNEVERLLQRHPLTAHTKKSFTDKWEFKEWLIRVREQGFAVDDERSFEGISGIAAPVRDFTGKVVAAIGVGYISSSLDSKALKKATKEVMASALTISREIGYLEKTNQH
jgi:DNA-binding IclR family transcriptional regulator